MLYKFKSRAAGDLILLDAPGRQILGVIGKSPDAQGIITVAQIPAALAALEAALAQEAARLAQAAEQPDAARDGDAQADAEQDGAEQSVQLRQRAAPFMELLRRSAAEGADVVWGV